MPASEEWLCPFCCITDHHRLSGWKPPIHYLPDAAGQKAERDGTGFSAQASQGWYPGAGRAAGSPGVWGVLPGIFRLLAESNFLQGEMFLVNCQRSSLSAPRGCLSHMSSSKTGHMFTCFLPCQPGEGFQHVNLHLIQAGLPQIISFLMNSKSICDLITGLISCHGPCSQPHWRGENCTEHACQGWKFGGGGSILAFCQSQWLTRD